MSSVRSKTTQKTSSKSLFSCSVSLEPVTPGPFHGGQHRVVDGLLEYRALGAHRDRSNLPVYRWRRAKRRFQRRSRTTTRRKA